MLCTSINEHVNHIIQTTKAKLLSTRRHPLQLRPTAEGHAAKLRQLQAEASALTLHHLSHLISRHIHLQTPQLTPPLSQSNPSLFSTAAPAISRSRDPRRTAHAAHAQRTVTQPLLPLSWSAAARSCLACRFRSAMAFVYESGRWSWIMSAPSVR